MLLILEPVIDGINYGAFTTEGTPVYEGWCPISEWQPKVVAQEFKSQVLTRLRGHGKVFTKVGIIVPFGEANQSKPIKATLPHLKLLATTQLRQQLLQPSLLVLQLSEQAWPHLPHLFLFNTHLSVGVTRDIILPLYPYESVKQFHINPLLLESYSHRANLNHAAGQKSIISLCVNNQVSAALFLEDKLKDAFVSYSPISSLTGLYGSGAVDPGFVLELSEKRKPADVLSFLTKHAGLLPTIETKESMDMLLQVAGLVPRDPSLNFDTYPIEVVEWIELSFRSFIRNLKRSIGSLIANAPHPPVVVIHSSLLSKDSHFWPLLFTDGLKSIKWSVSSQSHLQAASQDLQAYADTK